jgi:hypothetical protein
MMEQILECLLAEMSTTEERMEVKQEWMYANLGQMKVEIRTDQEEIMARLEAKIDAHNKKSEDLRGTLLSQTEIHYARTESTQQEI